MSYVELARARSGSSKSGSGTDSGRSSPRARNPLGEPAHDAISYLKQLIEERKEDLAVDAEFQQLTSLICASFTDIGVQSVECDDCGQIFRNLLERLRHVELVHGGQVKGHNCSICRKNFNSSINLARHRRKDHSSLSDIKFCNFCDLEVFESIHVHNKSHHPHACFPCKSDFQSPRERALHDGAIHSKVFICRSCWKAFSEKSNLLQHEQDSHKVFCQECPGKFFTSSKALEAHRTAKHPPRPLRVGPRRSA